MPAIALIDDREDDRKKLAKLINSTLRKLELDRLWVLKPSAPPESPGELLSWLDENEAVVLVADWRLDEQAGPDNPVDYRADSLIRELRTQRPTFPIFIITAYPGDADSSFGQVESICRREDFFRKTADRVQQIVRAGQRRHEDFLGLWSEFDRLSKKSATGKATASDKKKLGALAGELQAQFAGSVELDRVLDGLDDFRREFEALRRRLKARPRRQRMPTKKA